MTNHPPSVLWHCWLGHQTCKNRRPYNLYCVGADVKPCSINSINQAYHVVFLFYIPFFTFLLIFIRHIFNLLIDNSVWVSFRILCIWLKFRLSQRTTVFVVFTYSRIHTRCIVLCVPLSLLINIELFQA